MQEKHENPAPITTYIQFPFRLTELLTNPGYRSSLALVLLASLALYYQTFSFEFVWDDLTVALTKNEHLVNPSFRNILYFWFHPENGMYIPVTYTVWSVLELFNHTFLETAFYHGTYHITNILVHTFNGLLVLTIAHRFVKSRFAVTAGAILFVIHPLQVEVVAWAFELRMLLATFFGFCSLYLYLIFLDRNADTVNSSTTPFPWLSLVFFALALLSKPVSVIIPLLFIAVSHLLYGHTIVSVTKRVWPWLLLSITITVITLIEQPQERLTFQFDNPFWLSPLVWMDSINFYITKILFPISLSSSYGRTTDHLAQQWWFYISWIVPILIGLLLWRYYKQHKELLLGVTFFIIGFLSVSGILPFWFQSWSNVADRYMYLSMLGVAITFSYIFINSHSAIYRYVMISFLIFCFFWSVSIQIPIWRNEHSLWDHALQVKHENPRALYNRGVTYTYYGMWDKAIIDINESINLDRQRYKRDNNNAATNLPNLENLVENLNWSINILPDYTTYLLRTYAFLKSGDLEPAMLDLDHAIHIHPQVINNLLPSGISYSQLTKPEKILILLKLSATEFGLLIPDLYIYSALAGKYLGQNDQTVSNDLNKAIQLGAKPDNLHKNQIEELFNSNIIM